MLLWCQRHLLASMSLLLCLAGFGVCYGGQNSAVTGASAVGICYFLLRMNQVHDAPQQERRDRAAVSHLAVPAAQPLVDDLSSDDLVQEIVNQSRYVFLLMKQAAGKLSEEDFALAVDAFQRGMALVPEGDVEVYGDTQFVADDGSENTADRSPAGRLFHVEPFFLDRHPVTNRQYYEFVAVGGYREIALWDKRIWPAVLDMVDQTGLPGPRFWKNGCYLSGEEELPVVGIGWYEAAACARWLGKRLPTEAEWVKAASWPVPIDAKTLAHRRYPWGDTMDRARANVWGSGPNRIVAVREFAEGASIGGIYQLIGNVWEWTDGDFPDGSSDGKLELPTPMKSIRGGAFDTYFDSQAIAQFRSGENPLSRRHNIGFRCAIPMRDVVLARPTSEAPPTCPDQVNDEYEETAS